MVIASMPELCSVITFLYPGTKFSSRPRIYGPESVPHSGYRALHFLRSPSPVCRAPLKDGDRVTVVNGIDSWHWSPNYIE